MAASAIEYPSSAEAAGGELTSPGAAEPFVVTRAACGCAGSEVTTLTDEMNRQSNIYSDVLGRTWKTEVMTWPDENNNRSVYSSMVSVYNARDQVLTSNQYAGSAPAEASSTNMGVSCPTGDCQKTAMSYDGYGRLLSKHVPEQNAGTATTWSYNLDDTVNSVTHARGASATYVYNNGRHLVNGITYSTPSGITPTSNVSFGYDAAGNRTSMSDGLGLVSYGYNQLSQLTSETRNFADSSVSYLNASFTLTYAYNLAGELKTITDPWDGTIDYGFDSAGRLSNISGSGYGSVSQFLSNEQYRASGTLKSETYGNGFTQSATYNPRLLMTSFQVTNPSNQASIWRSYEYNADGAVKFAHNALDERFDRAFAYDHVGRRAEAMSGSQARDFINNTNSGPPTGPYGQSYAFNTFNQITAQVNRMWSDTQTTTSTFVDNRRQGWGYDAAGFLANGDGTSFFWDAAGRNTHTNGGGTDRWYQFDGDGRMLKQAASRNGNVTSVTYYLASTMLGGLAVAELNSGGQRTKRYIYAGNRKLAEEADGAVTWSHEEPVSGSRGDSTASGLYVPKAEFNADGVDVGFQPPPPPETPEPVTDWPRRGFGSGGAHCSGANPNCITCYVNHFEQNCSRVAELLDAGVVEQCPHNDCGPRPSREHHPKPQSPQRREPPHLVPYNDPREPWRPFDPNVEQPIHSVSGVPGEYLSVLLQALVGESNTSRIVRSNLTNILRDQARRAAKRLPNNPGVTPLDVGDLGNHMAQLLANSPCGTFVSALIATAANEQNPAHSTNVSELFEMIIGGSGGYFLDNRAPGGGGTIGGSIEGGNASVYLGFSAWSIAGISYDQRWNQVRDDQYSYAIKGIHETIHLSARWVLSDRRLAIAAEKITGIQTNFPALDETNTLAWSRYWNDILRDRCPPVRK